MTLWGHALLKGAACMAKNETKERIRSFLFKYLRGEGLEDDRDLFASGLVNSLFAMELVLFVEEDFKITVENEDLDLDNFCSIDAMVSFIERKKAEPAIIESVKDE